MKFSGMFNKKEFAIISYLRLISRKKIMLSWVEPEKENKKKKKKKKKHTHKKNV